MRHYSDYFHVKEDYCPNMTREEINQTPERWLDFCPHPEFEEICNTILSVQEQSLSGLLETLAQENPMPPS